MAVLSYVKVSTGQTGLRLYNNEGFEEQMTYNISTEYLR